MLFHVIYVLYVFLCMTPMRFLHITACVKHSFLFIAEFESAIRLSCNMFNHPLDGRLASLLFLFIIYIKWLGTFLYKVFGRHIFSVFVSKYRVDRCMHNSVRSCYSDFHVYLFNKVTREHFISRCSINTWQLVTKGLVIVYAKKRWMWYCTLNIPGECRHGCMFIDTSLSWIYNEPEMTVSTFLKGRLYYFSQHVLS